MSNLRGQGADFENVDLKETHFDSADLSGADFHGADARGANFDGARLIGADLRGGHFEQASFRGATLDAADMVGAHFAGADFKGATPALRVPRRCRFLRGQELLARSVRRALRRPRPPRHAAPSALPAGAAASALGSVRTDYRLHVLLPLRDRCDIGDRATFGGGHAAWERRRGLFGPFGGRFSSCRRGSGRSPGVVMPGPV